MRTTFRMIWQAADANRKLLRTEGSWYTPPAHGGDFAAFLAGVAELVDALDLGSSDESCGGSSPSARTNQHPFGSRAVGLRDRCILGTNCSDRDNRTIA